VSDLELERLVSAALHRDLPADERAKARIMSRVREASRAKPRRHDFHLRRGARHSIVGLALAAGIGSITTLSALIPSPVTAGASVSSVVLGDTVVSTLRDTLRLVRLMFADPQARRVAVVGDFNGWRSDATPLELEPGTQRWSVTIALRDGQHRYAFVVDGTRWVPDPSAQRRGMNDGRVYSLLNVARAAN
jgi:hypothetical protein